MWRVFVCVKGYWEQRWPARVCMCVCEINKRLIAGSEKFRRHCTFTPQQYKNIVSPTERARTHSSFLLQNRKYQNENYIEDLLQKFWFVFIRSFSTKENEPERQRGNSEQLYEKPNQISFQSLSDLIPTWAKNKRFTCVFTENNNNNQPNKK